MNLDLINGLPAHILFVHAVIVLVPLTALALLTAAVWPAAARRMGWALPLLGLVTLAFVPLSTEAGEWLEHHVDSDPLVRRHTELGDSMLPWALGLFLLSAVVWWVAGRRSASAVEDATRSPLGSAPLRAVAAILCLGVAAGAVVDVYRIGDSGAKAAWHDGYSQKATKPAPGGDDDEG